MKTRLALTLCSLLLASVVLPAELPGKIRAQPAAKPTVKTPRVTPNRDSSRKNGPLATPPSLDNDENQTTQLPDIKPFETGIEYQPTSPRARVTFNLEDADLPDLVRLISQITGRRFILPSKSRSLKATVYAPTKVTAAEAYQAFLSILELNGMAIVPSGSYLKIVESGRVEGRPIPLYTDDNAVPPGDRFITRLHRVEHIAAEDAATLLERFKSGDGSLTAYAPTNTLIITDTGTNLRRMLRILSAIDVARTGEQVWVEPIHHATASDLAARLSEIFDTEAPAPSPKAPAPKSRPARGRRPVPQRKDNGGVTTVGSSGSADTRISKIIADERTNSLIIVATESAYLRILEMLKHLDVPMEGEGRIHVHQLQHSDAEELASTLSGLVGGAASTPQRGKPQGAPGGGGNAIFEGKVAITAHKAANALVITSSLHDYAALRHVIDNLDTERRQVFIEAVIMELTVNRGSTLGLGYHGGVPDVPKSGSLFGLGFEAKRTIAGIAGNAEFLSGLAVGVQGPQLVGFSLPAFGVALQALATNDDVNVLSTPHLIAMDNVEAEISVGQNVPLQTSQVGLGSSNLGGLAGLLGNNANDTSALASITGLAGGLGLGGGFGVPRQDVGTTVTITPHINDTQEIRLEISEEISEAGAPSSTGNLGVVSINRTQAKTEVVVRDQQTVVIGGLMRDGVSNTVTKVPILGDIPLLGGLFRTTTKTKSKRNLLLFLTPYIIRSPTDLRSVYERKMRERQEFLDRYFVFSSTDYEPPMDYSRTRGLVGEIFLELKNLARQRELAAEANARPELGHEPRPPVGEAANRNQGDDQSEDGDDIENNGDAPRPLPDPGGDANGDMERTPPLGASEHAAGSAASANGSPEGTSGQEE